MAPTVDASVINFSWLLKLRWGAVAGQLVTVLVVDRLMHIHLPLAPLLAIIAFAAATNVVATGWVGSRRSVDERIVMAAIVLDVLLLTALLYLTGGPFNPFSFLYLVHIALAAVVLSERWTWGLVLLSLACFGALFLLPVSLPVDHDDPHMHGEHLRMHLEGMWVAFGVAAGFIVYFVRRVSRALAEREVELAEARALQERNEKFAALVTLAAGAAHELSSPLSTIAVASKELERTLAKEETSGAEDARLIREQVERCRRILSQMTASAGESMGEPAGSVPLGELVDAAVQASLAPERVEVEISPSERELRLRVPREAVARAVSNVVNNALQAAPESLPVRLRIECDPAAVRIVVQDRGAGMSEEVQRRVGEPFFTTRPPGAGMGLGIFLTQAVFRRIGGAVAIESRQGEGTTVRATIPARLVEPAASAASTHEVRR